MEGSVGCSVVVGLYEDVLEKKDAIPQGSGEMCSPTRPHKAT